MNHQQEWENCVTATTDDQLKEIRNNILKNKNGCPIINILTQYIKGKLQKRLKYKGMILANILEDIKQHKNQDLFSNIISIIRLELTIVYTEIIIKQNLINKQSYVTKILEHLHHLRSHNPTLKLPSSYALNYKIVAVVNLVHKGFKHEANYKINRLADKYKTKPTNNLMYAKRYINKECEATANPYTK